MIKLDFEEFVLPNNWFVENGLSIEATREPDLINNTFYCSRSDRTEIDEIKT